MCISNVNLKISEALKQEYNEVIFKAWLAFIETAEIENDNIIISVPNQYIKETFLERYAYEIEKLYRNSLSFDKLIVKTLVEKENIIYNIYPLDNSVIDISEIVNSYIEDIYGYIDSAIKDGYHNVSCSFLKDSSMLDELYFRIKEFLLNKGFKTELLTSNNNYTLSLSW